MTFYNLLLLIRILKKRWYLAILNIIGFGTGLAACLILGQKLSYELSYDKANDNYENIYRVSLDHYYPHDEYQNSTALSFSALGPMLMERYPEIERMTRIQGGNRENSTIIYEDEKFILNYFYTVDTVFFELFNVDLVHGSTNNLQFRDIFLAESLSTKIFGSEDPTGKTLELFGRPWNVRGVVRDIPSNTHFKYELLMVSGEFEPNWRFYSHYTYLELDENANIKELESKLEPFSTEFSKLSDESSQVEYRWEMHLQPLASIHLNSNLEFEHEENGSIQDIYLLMAIIFMVMIISCFNFTNLQRSINQHRIGEFQIRKVFGASPSQLLAQNIFESFVFIVIASVVTILIITGLFNQGGESVGIELHEGRNYTILGGILLIFIVITLLFPAFQFLKTVSFHFLGQGHHSTEKMGNGGFLAVPQFVISVILIATAITVNKQLSFLNNTDLGYSSEDVLTLSTRFPYGYAQGGIDRLKTELEQNQNIKSVAVSETIPGDRYMLDGSFRFVEEPEENSEFCYLQLISPAYFETFEIEVLAGRPFSENRTNEQAAVLINESLAKLLNAPYDEIIGRKGSIPWGRDYTAFEVIGVVKDYYHQTMRSRIEPCAYLNIATGGPVNNISVRFDNVKGEERQAIYDLVKNSFETAFPRDILNLSYAREVFEIQFMKDRQFSNLVNIITLISIFMTILGFVGLAANDTRKRTREVAIRKVNGANLNNIITLFGVHYLKILALTFIVALPLSIYIVKLWLDNFITRIDLSAWFALWPIVIVTTVSLLSVGYYVAKVAIQDPVKILRDN